MTGPDGSATPGGPAGRDRARPPGTSPTSSPPASRWCSPTATAPRWATCWSRTSWPRTWSRRCRWTGTSPRPRPPSRFTLADELDAALAARGLPQRTAGLVTRTLVDADDPHFREPVQAGRPLPPPRGGRAVRRPRPDLGGPRRAGLAPRRRLARAEVGRRLAGDPRARRGRLRRRLRRRRRHPGGATTAGTATALRGVEAVIDKDLTAAILARELDADTLVIATDVPNVMVDFGTPSARPLRPGDRRRAARARRGRPVRPRQHGPEGRRRPPLRRGPAAPRAVITSLEHIADAVTGDDAGTVLTA